MCFSSDTLQTTCEKEEGREEELIFFAAFSFEIRDG